MLQFSSVESDRIKELMIAYDAQNICKLAALFINSPYRVSPLIGDARTEEVLVCSLEEYDCVTFVETVVAIALSNSLADFSRNLIKLRYTNSQVDWLSRNHYFYTWINQNLDIFKVVNQPKSLLKRTLNCLPEYPEIEVHLSLSELNQLTMEGRLKANQIIAFGTTQENLDYRHVGFVCGDSNQVSLIHASRSQGKVVCEQMSKFVENYGECPGVTILELR